jgi:transglutaminase-like putative cysteine protease
MTTESTYIEMYREISRRLGEESVIKVLQAKFNKKQTLRRLLNWVHTQLTFNKGKIERHNDPFDILEYDRGKCREFSVLFAAVCLANGYRARLILDMSDHAWVEVWVPRKNRWIHVDPSEKRIDEG